ncbi:hypothetical protein L9F63_020516, partial [Diploptera punctata]
FSDILDHCELGGCISGTVCETSHVGDSMEDVQARHKNIYKMEQITMELMPYYVGIVLLIHGCDRTVNIWRKTILTIIYIEKTNEDSVY